MRVLVLFFLSLPSSFALVSLDVEIGREGQMLMRQDKGKSAVVVRKSNLLEIEAAGGDENRPLRRGPAEAAEAFANPSKIDDSFFGSWAPSMPGFVEKYPYFYAAAFVFAGFAFLGVICGYVHYEDAKDDERREMMIVLRREAAGMPHRMGAAFAPRGAPPLSPEAMQSAANLAASAMARAPVLDGLRAPMHESSAPTPQARAARAVAAAENGLAALTNAMNQFTGHLGGDSMKKSWSPDASTDTTSASGASTPRSLGSSHLSSESSRSKLAGIRNGTVLVARVPEVIFASPTSWQEIGELTAGQQVYAAGPPVTADSYTMVPIQPRGAVDMKTLDVMRL